MMTHRALVLAVLLLIDSIVLVQGDLNTRTDGIRLAGQHEALVGLIG